MWRRLEWLGGRADEFEVLGDGIRMTLKCPRCSTRNLAQAVFCGRCGVNLQAPKKEAVPCKKPTPARHPDLLDPPEGFREVGGMPGLHYRWAAAWGGSMLLGTETIAVVIFNGGYALEEVVLSIYGLDAAGDEVFCLDMPMNLLPRGRETTLEVPSYEMSAPASDLTVSLVSGRYASPE